MKHSTWLVILSIAILSCAQAPVRSLPVADEMPTAPAGAVAAVAPGDFLSFYPKAPSMMDKGPDLSLYGIECSVMAGGGYFTLARTHDGKSALFVLTGRPVTSLADTISFGRPGRSLDWGFVYDRNGDGWVDYVAYLDGAMPVETTEVVEQIPGYPKPKPGEGRKATQEEIRLALKNLRLVFIHHADDNFDGKADAIVSALQDPDRWGWIYRRAVLRSRNHSQAVDEDWIFVQDINLRTGPVPRTGAGRFEKLEGLRVSDSYLEASSKLFDLLNSGIRGCRIPKGAMPRD